MCTKPLIINGYEVACRECDQCLATYKNSWVARCVAEMDTLPHALVFTLTYGDVDGQPPLGAKVFNYQDVQALWKRIRSAAGRKIGKGDWLGDFRLSYVCVGEKGTRFGRVHYHGVMFATHPIKEIGAFQGARSRGFAHKRRLGWSMWDHGFCEFQPATREGISYALKYILKSRMTAARSEGFAREGKTEWLASSYLWCSKKPPIGMQYLWDLLTELEKKGMCPTSLRIRTPGGGDWYVMGEAQRQMCLFIHEAQKKCQRERGRDLHGWKQLLASVEEDIELADTGEVVPRKAKEWLHHGDKEEAQVEYHPRQELYDLLGHIKFRDELARKQSARAKFRCFGIRACPECERFRSPEDIDGDKQVEALWREVWARPWQGGPRSDNFVTWLQQQGLVAEGCLGKHDDPEGYAELSAGIANLYGTAGRMQKTSR